MPAITHLFSRTLNSFRPVARMDARARQQHLYRELGAAAVAEALLELDAAAVPPKDPKSARAVDAPAAKATGIAA